MTVDLGVLVTVAWCPTCRWWIEDSAIGSSCPSLSCDRLLVRRDGYLCRERGIHRAAKAAKRCTSSHDW